MIHVYKDQRTDRMAPRAIEARIIGYTETYGVYQTITTTGKRQLAKDPRPIVQDKEEDEEEELQWPEKLIIQSPEQPQTLERPNNPDPETPSQQLLQEMQEAPAPRKSSRIADYTVQGKGITNWGERIKQGLGTYINRVGHDEDHPTDE